MKNKWQGENSGDLTNTGVKPFLNNEVKQNFPSVTNEFIIYVKDKQANTSVK